MRIDNKIEELFREFGSSMSVNLIVHGPGDVSDLRGELLRGCVQCGERIGEFMLSQDIACALTAGEYKLKPEATKLLKRLWNNAIPLSEALSQVDGLVRAAGATAEVLKSLKENDPTKFLEVLSLLWRYEQESKTWRK
jgi:hypothetical protein